MRFSCLDRVGFTGAIAFVLCSVSSTFAQTAEPDSSSLSFQDWIVNCANTKPKAPTDKPMASVCEMVQSYIDKDSQKLVGRIEIGRPRPGADFKLVIQAPIGVSIPEGATLTIADKTVAKAPYLRCAPAVCIAETDLKKDFIDAAKTADKMTMTFSDGTHSVVLNVSTKGFAPAMAALDKR